MTDQAQAETVAQDDAGLSLLDLKNVLTIIDVASERGTWRGGELTQIGAVRDKFAKLLEALAPKPEDAPEGPEAPAEEAAAEEAEEASE